MPLDIPVRESEIYRYLGYKNTPSSVLSERDDAIQKGSFSGMTVSGSRSRSGASDSAASIPDRIIEEKVRRCLRTLKAMSTPHSVRQYFELSSPAENVLSFAGITVHSRNLYKNARGCRRICLFAATIGPACDRLIARAQLTDHADAAIYQAAGAALIESYCDLINRKIIAEQQVQHLYCRPRFSPGYGDLPLTLQSDFEKILQMNKKCGIAVNDSLLLSPSKSVTAMIAISDQHNPCILSGCEACENAGACPYSRKGDQSANA